jgi:hypothetical protein
MSFQGVAVAMMETKQLRRADFITSIILMLFGAWVLFESFKMPMRDTYGGVQNVWYVSPALLPLIVGAGILILGAVLLVAAVKRGGAADFISHAKRTKPQLSEANQRFLAILLALLSFVYFFIPRVDFFLAVVLFLTYFVHPFYYDDTESLRKLSYFYAGIVAVFILLFVTGLANAVNGVFEFSTDILALASIVALNVYARRLAGRDAELIRKFRVAMVVIILTPLILVPVFRFLLLVPLPKEGGIVQVMQLVWYSLR